MKILFVGFPYSIHTYRWISQLESREIECYFFPNQNNQTLNPNFKNLKYFESFYKTNYFNDLPNNDYYSPYLNFLSFSKNSFLKKSLFFIDRKINKENHLMNDLLKVIKIIKPDIIHSMETQNSGYLVSLAKENCKGKFPIWVHSIWGIDLHFYGNKPSHQSQLRKCISAVDFLITEGKRDYKLAVSFGYKYKEIIFPSVGGGFFVPDVINKKPSERKIILVKGWQDECRNALNSLEAIGNCAKELETFEVIVYSANKPIIDYVEKIKKEKLIKIQIVDNISNQNLIDLNKKARVSICVNFSDGVPNAMLEAMMCGAFPIQSNTSMAEEWIEDGITGILVPPDNVELTIKALKTALQNDDLVDKAGIHNHQLIQNKLNYHKIREEVLDFYNGLF
jgi:glycosyltransferase involved in cell wall biosynthesis